MSKRGSITAYKYLTKNYFSPVKGVKSAKTKLLKLRKDDSLDNIIFKFKYLSKKNRRFIDLWNAFEGSRKDTIGYFYGSYKIFSDNIKMKEYEIFHEISEYKKDGIKHDLFDYLKNYLKLKKRR